MAGKNSFCTEEKKRQVNLVNCEHASIEYWSYAVDVPKMPEITYYIKIFVITDDCSSVKSNQNLVLPGVQSPIRADLNLTTSEFKKHSDMKNRKIVPKMRENYL